MLRPYYGLVVVIGGSFRKEKEMGCGGGLHITSHCLDHLSGYQADGKIGRNGIHEIFKRVERSNFLSIGTPGRGFHSFLQPNIGDWSIYLDTKPRLSAIRAGIKLLILDLAKEVNCLNSNSKYGDPNCDITQRRWLLPFHAYKNWKGLSSRNYILAARAERKKNATRKYTLHLQLNSLDHCSNEKEKPLQWTEGDPRWNSTITGKPSCAYAFDKFVAFRGTEFVWRGVEPHGNAQKRAANLFTGGLSSCQR